MQSFCTVLILIRSAQLSTKKNKNTVGLQGGAGGRGRKEGGRRSEVEGSEEGKDVGRRRRGEKDGRSKDKGRPKLFHSGEGGKKTKSLNI